MITYRKNSKQKKSNTNQAGNICVAGVGGAGCNVLDRMALEGMSDAELVAINCDVRTLQNTMCPRQLQLGAKLTRGLGTGGDPELGRDAAIDSQQEIDELFNQRDMVFLCAGLGGGTGSGATPQMVRTAREKGAFVVVFAILPFSFEGRRRLQQANTALDQLRQDADVLIVFENDRMGELALNKEGIQQAFAAADTVISQSIRSIHTLVRQPGLIQIGMDDLMSALRNDDSRCLFGYGDAKGENRAHEALKRALKSPLLNQGELLEQTSTILVHVAGGESLTLFEVELLMRELEKQIPESAHILFGTAIDPKLGDLLSVSIISSLSATPDGGSELDATENTAEPVEQESPQEVAAENQSEDQSHAWNEQPEAVQSGDEPDQPASKDTARITVETASEENLTVDPDEPEAPSEEATPELFGFELQSADDMEDSREEPEAEQPALEEEPTPEAAADETDEQPQEPVFEQQTEPEPVVQEPVVQEEVAATVDPATEASPVDHKGPIPINALAAIAAAHAHRSPHQTHSSAPAAGVAEPMGRRLPTFDTLLSQTAPATPQAPKSSVLKALANGSVPLDKLSSGPLSWSGDKTDQATASEREMAAPTPGSPPATTTERVANETAEADDSDINPIAAAMRAADPREQVSPHQDIRRDEDSVGLTAVDHEDDRDFGRPEAERGTIEPFPSQTRETTAGHAMATSRSAHQGVLDLNPGSKGRFDHSEPSIIGGEDIDVPAFLRRSR